MRKTKIACVPVILLFAAATFGQINQPNHLPYKDLIFAQLAAGGIWETQITVTNRGIQQWQGYFDFYTGEGLEWNPYVNGVPLTGGSLPVTILPKRTATYRITVPGSTVESGFLKAIANNTNLNNYIEGNLTWYVKDGATITDSIGVLPSNPFLAATIPFEDFNSVCLAFANTDAEGRPAHMKLQLYSELGVKVGSTLPLDLQSGEHLARYLREIFQGVTLGRGRVEIASGVPVSGVALIQTGSQFSSLPLNSTTRTYQVDAFGSEVNFAQLILWTEGLFINGYLSIERESVLSLFAITGSFRDGKALLHFDGDNETTSDYGVFGFLLPDDPFDPDQTTFTGVYDVAIPSEGRFITGWFVATLVP
jgi:hypothetical protein